MNVPTSIKPMIGLNCNFPAFPALKYQYNGNFVPTQKDWCAQLDRSAVIMTCEVFTAHIINYKC